MGNDWDELPEYSVTSAQVKEGKEMFLDIIFNFNEQFTEVIKERYKQNEKLK